MLLDELDDQLTTAQLEDLRGTATHDEASNKSDDAAAAFMQAFETRFSSRVDDRLSHEEGEEE